MRQMPTRLPYSKKDSLARSRSPGPRGGGRLAGGLAGGVAVEGGVLGALLVVDDHGDGDACIVGPAELRRVGAVADEVALLHGVGLLVQSDLDSNCGLNVTDVHCSRKVDRLNLLLTTISRSGANR